MTTCKASAADRAVPTGFSHTALMTADLDRSIAFYENTIGLRPAVILRMGHPPYLRHALMFVGEVNLLHLLESREFDGSADPGTLGRRGRLDHLGFVVPSQDALDEVAARLVSAGASDGVIRSYGSVLSATFRDPDGFEGEINAVDSTYDPTTYTRDCVEATVDHKWFQRLTCAWSSSTASPFSTSNEQKDIS